MTESAMARWQHKAADFAGVSAEVARQHPRPQPPQGHWVRGQQTPLTANQHILHLLLTVFTGGLWGIVWAVRACQGNQAWHWVPATPAASSTGRTAPSGPAAP